MEVIEQFKTLKKNHEAGPSYSNYTALENLAKKHGKELGLKKTKIAILRNFTVEPLLPMISGEMALTGLEAETFLTDFDTIPENVFNPESDFYKSKPDYILMFQWAEILTPLLTNNFLTLGIEQAEAEVERVIHLIESFFKAIRTQNSAPILINNFPLPTFNSLGILDAQNENYQTYSFLKLNTELLKMSKKYSGIYWVDFMNLFARHGSINAKDEKHWQMSKAPIGRSVINAVAYEYGKFFKSFVGKTKKCLVLDCDNTLWGGVIGEDGLGGIKLGTSYPGQSFKDFQQEILNLYHRGVILALCSKNNEQDILDVLDQHGEMLLKKKHFATWQINWDDKATNLQRIAQDLNIGIDSLVFVDDNPFECNWVREKLPEVTVVELGKDILAIKRKLEAPGFFDSLVFSAEDKKRNEMYASDKERKTLMSNSGSMDDYLKSLELETTFGKISTLELPRVAQLTQKTNQFNLTTFRYTEAEVDHLQKSDQAEVYFMQLQDKVSDLGIIGAAIVKYDQKIAHIDTLLLSCRALGRGAEDTLLSLIINRAQIRGCHEVRGEYIKSAKNAQVKDFYEKRHFSLVEEKESTSSWKLVLENHVATYPSWIKLRPTHNLEINYKGKK